MCRGLIIDDAGSIVARPFTKFFNHEELGPEWVAPTGGFTVTDKMDGSLGISYTGVDGYPEIATRGSFTSDQAIHATKVLYDRYGGLPWNTSIYTYLFEIIYPENRIVVDYGRTDDLILLAAVETAAGKEALLPEWFPNHVKTYDGITDIATLKDLAEDNREGFVVRFGNGDRVKVKFAEYVRLHRLVTGVTARVIWEMLAAGKSLDELLQRVPEEFEEWVKQTSSALRSRYADIELECILDETNYEGDQEDRKVFAHYALTKQHPAILFAMRDEKPYDHIIWKMIKPKAERPFKKEEDV